MDSSTNQWINSSDLNYYMLMLITKYTIGRIPRIDQ